MKTSIMKKALLAAVAGAAITGFADSANAQRGYERGGYDRYYGYDMGPRGGWDDIGYVTPGSYTRGHMTPAQHNACLQEYYQRPERTRYRC